MFLCIGDVLCITVRPVHHAVLSEPLFCAQQVKLEPMVLNRLYSWVCHKTGFLMPQLTVLLFYFRGGSGVLISLGGYQPSPLSWKHEPYEKINSLNVIC